MLAPNTILKNRYRILQQLGQGGMGAVYQAVDENLNRMVAVKETFATSEEWRRAFRREAELLANLRHPALPKSIELFSEKGSDFFVMEFIPGDDLAALLARRGSPFPESDVLKWADEALSVLDYLHTKNLIHRDIKPSNIKLSSDGDLCLIDFGLAKGAVGQMPTLTTPKSAHGYTLAFAPIEQITGKGTDARSDLYSLGATLYNLLTGKPPLDASLRLQMKEDRGTDPLPLIQLENPHVSPETAAIIHSALALSRDRRPATAADMRNALRGAYHDIKPTKPVTPRPEPVKPTKPVEPRPQPIKPTEPFKPQTPPQPTVTAQAPVNPVGWNSRIFDPVERPQVEPSRSNWSLRKVKGVIGAVVLGFMVLSGVVWVLKASWSFVNQGSPTEPTVSLTSASPSPTTSPTTSPSPKPSPSLKAGDTMQNGLGIEFSYVPAGSFMMGSTNYWPEETPVHRVTFSNGFFIGKYEITQGMWRSIMANNPSRYPDCGDTCPVENVSWNSVQQFIAALNSSNDGYLYRLPTESEWEYAARAGTKSDLPANLNDVAWYTQESIDIRTGQRTFPEGFRPTHPVGSKRANAFGLHDMLGNVSEWCEDYYHNSYSRSPVDGKPRVDPGEMGERVLRGGSSIGSDADTRFARRYKSSPNSGGQSRDNWFEGYGFRLVAVPRDN